MRGPNLNPGSERSAGEGISYPLQFSSASPVAQLLKNLPCNVRDLGLVLGLGRSLEEGNSNPLQFSCLGNPMDREAWRAPLHEVASELDMDEQLNNYNKGYAIKSSTL